jgi:hypothetical protein
MCQRGTNEAKEGAGSSSWVNCQQNYSDKKFLIIASPSRSEKRIKLTTDSKRKKCAVIGQDSRQIMFDFCFEQEMRKCHDEGKTMGKEDGSYT